MTRPRPPQHARTEVVGEVEGAVDVDVGGQPPALRGVLEGGAGHADGGVVDQQVAAPEALVDGVRERAATASSSQHVVAQRPVERGGRHSQAPAWEARSGEPPRSPPRDPSMVQKRRSLAGESAVDAGADDQGRSRRRRGRWRAACQSAAAGAGDERNGFRHGCLHAASAGGVAILAHGSVEGKRGGRIPKQSCLWIVVELYTKVTLAYGTG